MSYVSDEFPDDEEEDELLLLLEELDEEPDEEELLLEASEPRRGTMVTDCDVSWVLCRSRCAKDLVRFERSQRTFFQNP